MRKGLASFLAGAAVGATVAVAANKYLKSERGRRMQENIRRTSVDFYNFAKHRLESIKDFGKEEYGRVVNDAAEEYGRVKNLSKEAVKDIVDRTMDLWDDVASGNK